MMENGPGDKNVENAKKMIQQVKPSKGMFGVVAMITIGVAFFMLWGSLTETVKSGSYHVIQRPVTGKMEAKMKPGMYLQLFSDVEKWAVSETFYFTSDYSEGEKHDQSIEVRFNDGSIANISGTCRVLLPTNAQQAIELMTKHGFNSYEDLAQRLILPVLRNSLRLTANLMTARESYAEGRLNFNSWSWDQIQNGLYLTEEIEKKTVNPMTQEVSFRKVKIIKRDADGTPMRDTNPFKGTGISLTNFEVKRFVYETKVKAQIDQQQKNLMAIATARSKAELAEQEKRTQKAEGEARVMEAKYQKEEEKIRAVVDAEKEKEVAVLKAEKEVAVAKLQKEAAKEDKQRMILLGEGEAERKTLVMKADGALKQKLEAWISINKTWADAYSKRNVPSVFMSGGAQGGSSSPDEQFRTFMNMMNVKAANDIAADVKIKSSKSR